MAKKPALAAVPNGASGPAVMAEPEDIDYGLGEMVLAINPPELLGTITVAEVAEIKQRNASLQRLNDDIKHFAALRAIATNEKNDFLRGLGHRLGGGPRDEFNINDETGAVFKTATRRYAQPAPPEPTEAEPTPESTEDAAIVASSGDSPEGSAQ